MNTEDDEYQTVTEAADMLKVSEKTIRRWINDGTLLAYYAGPRNIRIKLSDLENTLRKTN